LQERRIEGRAITIQTRVLRGNGVFSLRCLALRAVITVLVTGKLMYALSVEVIESVLQLAL
jgi:hypothetical protein